MKKAVKEFRNTTTEDNLFPPLTDKCTWGETAGRVPGNPFGVVYIINKIIDGYVTDFKLYAGAAGTLDILLYKKGKDGYTLAYTYTVNVQIGENIIPINMEFTGKPAIRCRTGKFYYAETSLIGNMTALKLTNTDAPNPTTLTFDEADKAGVPGVVTLVVEGNFKIIEQLSSLTEWYKWGRDFSGGTISGNVPGILYFINKLIDSYIHSIEIPAVRTTSSVDVLLYELVTDNDGSEYYRYFTKYNFSGVSGKIKILLNYKFRGKIALWSKTATGDFFWFGTPQAGKTAMGVSSYVLTDATKVPLTISTENVNKNNLPTWDLAIFVEENYKVVSTELRVEALEKAVYNPSLSLNGLPILANFRNSNLPDKWTNNGFTATANGLQSPASGGIGTYIEYDQYSNLDSFITAFRLNMVTASNVLLTNHHKKYSGTAGHVVGFDMVNKKLTIYQGTAPNVLPSVILKQETISFDFKPGETLIKYTRNAMLESYTIANGSGSFTMEYNTQTDARPTAGGYDKFGLVFLQGNVIVTNAWYSTQMNIRPDWLILGDSIVNGDTVRTLVGGGMNGRWAGILSQHLDVAIWSLGGNTVGDIIRDIDFVYSIFKPKKGVIFAVGINDSVLSTYANAAQIFIEKTKVIGCEPILITLFPRDGRAQYCTDMSNWVKNSGCRYIDFRRRMTVDGLGVNRRQELYLTDNLHPNVTGHSEMAEEALITLDV